MKRGGKHSGEALRDVGLEDISRQNQVDDALHRRDVALAAEVRVPRVRSVAGVVLQRPRVGKQRRKFIGSTACALAATSWILLWPSGRSNPASVVTMVVGDYHVIEMQDRLRKSLTGNCRGRQSLQCPVQIIGKEAGDASLERREIGAMLLRVFGKKGAKGGPWIDFERRSAATRLSVRDHIGAEWVAGQV